MISIAIDGPSGAGKSTVARQVAKRLGYLYVDTGALYRAIGLHAVRTGVCLQDADAIAASLAGLTLSLKFVDGEQRVFVGEQDVTEYIRTPEVSMAASAVSAVPKVREFLFSLQQDLARRNNVVMDGRDIGTVILPHAQVKIFLTASVETRARRRQLQLEQAGEPISYERLVQEIQQRDTNDTNRASAPLRQAEDAVLLDSSDLTFEQTVEAVLALISQTISQQKGF